MATKPVILQQAKRRQALAVDAGSPIMADHGHGDHGATQSGNFNFLVASAAVYERIGHGATRPLLRSTIVLAVALAALVLLDRSGVLLGGDGPTMAACLAILLFGLPHGALDLEIIKRQRRTGRLGMVALLLLYVGLAAAVAVFWRYSPVGALVLFIGVSVVHFAEDWTDLGSPFLAQSMAIALLCAPTLFYLADIEHLFIAVSGSSEAALAANLMLLIAPMSVAVAGLSLWTLWRASLRDQALVGGLALAGVMMLPPVIGFAFFFCLFHSPRHLSLARSQIASSTKWRWVVLLVTLAALGISVLLFAGAVRSDMPARFVAASFMTLSLLTVPHMAVPLIARSLARWHRGTQRRHED